MHSIYEYMLSIYEYMLSIYEYMLSNLCYAISNKFTHMFNMHMMYTHYTCTITGVLLLIYTTLIFLYLHYIIYIEVRANTLL